MIVALAATAHAGDPALDEARRLQASLEYEPALVIVERVIAAGGASRDELVERHLLAGSLAAGLDRVAVAEDHFARVLALAPATTLPEGTSPKLTEPFDAARARTVPLRVHASAKDTTIVLVADADPLGLVHGAAVVLADKTIKTEPNGLRIELFSGAHVAEARALDGFGNIVWTETVGGVLVTPRPAIPHAEPGPPPLYRRWYLWGAATVVALAAGGVCGAQTRSQQDKWDELHGLGMTDYSVLRDIEARGRRYALAANISFGVAVATGLTAAIMFATRDDRSGRRIVPNGAGVTALVTRDAYGLAVVGGF